MSGTFLDEIAVGRYIDGDSPLHRAHTGWKAFLFTSLAVVCFFLHSAGSFFLVGALIGSLSLAAGLPQQLFWRSLRPVNLLALFTILAGAFINHPQGSVLNPVFSWTGLQVGGLYAARLVCITLLTTLYFLTTPPKEAIRLGINLLRPLRLMGIDKQELSLLVHLAYRFVPMLRREIEEVRMGREARNLPQPQAFGARMKTGSETLTFLFVGALHRAETTAYALEERRVLESWRERELEERPSGAGGWMLALVALGAMILPFADSYLL